MDSPALLTPNPLPRNDLRHFDTRRPGCATGASAPAGTPSRNPLPCNELPHPSRPPVRRLTAPSGPCDHALVTARLIPMPNYPRAQNLTRVLSSWPILRISVLRSNLIHLTSNMGENTNV